MSKLSIRSAALTAVLVTLSVAAPALAKPVCFNDGSRDYYFAKMKLPKKPGQVTALQGVRPGGLGPSVAVGGATMWPNGMIHFALFVHASNSMDSDSSLNWTSSDGIAGVGFMDTDGDYQKDDQNVTVTVVDCSTLMFP